MVHFLKALFVFVVLCAVTTVFPIGGAICEIGIFMFGLWKIVE